MNCGALMGSEEHVFNKKLISGSMRTANGAHMKMLCEGEINVDVITKNGDITSGTLRVKVIPGMKQKLFSFTQAINRKKSKALNKVTKSHTMLAQDSFLGSLLVFASGVVEWNCWMKQQSNTQNQGALMAIQTGCLGALHGSQSLTALNR